MTEQALLENNADIDAGVIDGATAFHAAASNSGPDIVKVASKTDLCLSVSRRTSQVFLDYGARVDVVDDLGQTPLIHAAIEGLTDNVEVRSKQLTF